MGSVRAAPEPAWHGWSAARAALGHGLRAAIEAEPILAPGCALLLLLYPNPLALTAAFVGVLPSAARWTLFGRPWRATPFDIPLVLLAISVVVGYGIALESSVAAVRLAGVLAGFIIFAWLRERADRPERALRVAGVGLAVIAIVGVALLSIAAPFLRLDRLPPLAWLATLVEPLGLYQPLVGDEAILQRYRLYASGVGALADVGLALTVGLAVATRSRGWRTGLSMSGLFFGGLLLVADNRGALLAGALTLGLMILCWRPRLFWLAPLLLFGTFDLIALGLVQRGLNLRTVIERLDFWANGLALGTETAYTGTGLGVRSVQLAYIAAYQPTYPPFFHAHNIYVQVFLEQGVVGLVGLVGATIVTLWLGLHVRCLPDRRSRGAGLAAFGAAVALLACGLTEVVALTTIGGVLLFGALGLLAAASEQSGVSGGYRLQRLPQSRASLVTGYRGRGLNLGRQVRRRDVILAIGLAGVLVLAFTGLWRPLLATVPLNVGTSALDRATLDQGLPRDDRNRALSLAAQALNLAASIDPTSVAARRNLALTLAAANHRDDARQQADAALALASPNDRRALFGVGRAYVAVGAWDQATRTWEWAGAGPQLLKLGARLANGQDWKAAIGAYLAAANLDAPGRAAVDGITRTALAHGETPDQAVGRLASLARRDGETGYEARLQIAHVYREAGRLDEAEAALVAARMIRHDGQLDLELGLLAVARGQYGDAEPLLAQAVRDLTDAPVAVPEDSDPRYWLGLVRARLGR
jgi:O-antigen ligase